MKTFNSLEELHKEWEINDACIEGIEFNHSCKTLQEVFEKCPLKLRLWRLSRGYVQFEEHCPWDKLNGVDWASLLSRQPKYAELCQWNKFEGYNWVYLLSHQPQFANICGWEKLDRFDWIVLLLERPQYVEYYKFNILHKKDWKFLVKQQPALKNFYKKLKK